MEISELSHKFSKLTVKLVQLTNERDDLLSHLMRLEGELGAALRLPNEPMAHHSV